MNIYIYIAVIALVSYLIRVLPLTLIRKPITNVTLAVMTFPAILHATSTPIAGAAALIIGMMAAWQEKSLFQVALFCCTVVLGIELIL